MKRNSKKYFLLIVPFITSIYTKAQTTWTMADPKNLDFTISTTIIGNNITGKTRKDALHDYVGALKYKLIKMASPLKYPEIIHFEGTFDTKNPSIFKGVYYNLFSQNNCYGKITGDSIVITLLNKLEKPIKVIKGYKNEYPKSENYEEIVLKIINLTEEHLFNPSFLKSKDWKNFKSRLIASSGKMEDKLELQTGFYAIARDFPFTHYNLIANRKEQENKTNFSLSSIDKSSCLLKIKSFEGDRLTIDTLIEKIENNQYSTLIIDLRDNAGGSNETALPLMSYLSDKAVTGGVFPNKNWYKEHKTPPIIHDYDEFNEFNFGTLEEFYSMAKNRNGLYIRSLPGKSYFRGKVYILCNENTASTSEVLIQGLRENNIGQLVGKKTAGAALSGRRFHIDKDLSLFIPVNDYISHKGYKIDKHGIKPDIEVETDALKYVLKKIDDELTVQQNSRKATISNN